MKQFLRFQISGLSCIFWVVIFLTPYINWQIINQLTAKSIVLVLAAGVTLALPLGTIIHQISITILSPFRKFRLFNKRKVLDDIENINFNNNEGKFSKQSILVLKQSFTYQDQEGGEKTFNLEHIRDEISSRYSYYYVRVDNGLIAPLLGILFSILAKWCLNGCKKPIFLEIPILPSWTMPLAALVFCALMLAYLPTLMKEVDDLERFVVNFDDIDVHNRNSLNTKKA